MADWAKAIKRYLKEKQGIDLDDFKEKERPVMDMRKKQGEGMWQGDIGIEDEIEEEKKKKKDNK